MITSEFPVTTAGLSAEEEEFDLLVERAFADEWFSEAHAIERGEGRIVLRGEVDMAALAELDAALSELEDEQPLALRVELSEATFVSTAAMLRIIDTTRHVGHVTVCGANMTVRRIFSVLDIERRCELID
jgi:ABC-type transporter Mla MlaB component